LLHGLISLGYGIDLKNSVLVSEGLSQIAFSPGLNTPLSELSPSRRSRLSTHSELVSCLALLRNDPRVLETRQKLTIKNFLMEDSLPLLEEMEQQFYCGPCSTPEEILEALNLLYSLSFVWVTTCGLKDFTILHILTSAPCLVALCEVVNPQLALSFMRQWWRFILTAYVMKGCPNFEVTLVDNPLPWEEIKSRAFKHNDEHVVKGVLGCFDASKQEFLPESVKKVLPTIAMTLLAIPCPPAEQHKRFGGDDWIYPSQKNPWETVKLPDTSH